MEKFFYFRTLLWVAYLFIYLSDWLINTIKIKPGMVVSSKEEYYKMMYNAWQESKNLWMSKLFEENPLYSYRGVEFCLILDTATLMDRLDF